MSVEWTPLDHLGVAVRDLAEGYELYTRVGFNLTPLSIHSGQAPDGTIQAFGSGNHCAFFKLGYLELIGVVDPEKPSSVAPFLASRQGGFITALGTGNPDAAYDIAAASFPSAQRPVLLQRPVDDGNGGTGMAQFRNMLLGASFPESRVLMIEHLTRDLIWRPEYMTHPNGAVGLAGAQFVVDDPAEAAARYARLTGGRPGPMEGGGVRLDLGEQELQFLSPGSPGPSTMGNADAHCPSLSGGIFRVSDIAATRSHLERNGVAFQEISRERVVVPPDGACGFAVTFAA